MRQPEALRDRGRLRHPAVAEIGGRVRRAHAHEFSHAEGLEAIDLVGRLAPEAVGRDIEQVSAGRDRAARSGERIERITGRGREHEVARLQRAGPVVATIEAGERGVDLAIIACKAADAAEQMGKAAEVPGLLHVAAAHHRREPQHLGAGLAVPRDQGRQPVDDRLEERGAAMNAGAAGRRE
jgi:hypothetical protein